MPGPIGARIHVIDFDGVHRRYYEPIDLDDRDVLIRDGLPPSETDPRFHQQMVYAIVAELWADFETALGRRTSLGSRRVLTIVPHAFYGENAYYDPDGGALLFGYFKASQTSPGANLPGQMVFTCLSHDIVVHETTHALIDRLRPQFMLDMNPDVAAFHEGFADLIAIFQHFKMPEVLLEALTDSRGEIGRSEQLLGLARQFGYSTGMGEALRTAIGPPDASLYLSTLEPHARGAILVRAVFDAFLSLYHQRTQDLVRLASEGTGVLREGELPPDLVQRLADEASMLARQMFGALIRAFDYLPPLDVTFEDFLRALVTVDFALSPSDDSVRVAFIEGFRRHGIFPTSAGSLGDYAVAWTRTSDVAELPFDAQLIDDVIVDLDNVDYTGFTVSPGDEALVGADPWKRWGVQLQSFAEENCDRLGFVKDQPIRVEARHPTLRYRANGRPTYDLVVRFLQARPDLRDLVGGVTPMAGTTVVAGSDRIVRYIISKPIEPHEDGQTPSRFISLQRRVEGLRLSDPGDPYRDEPLESRLRLRMTALHQFTASGDPVMYRIPPTPPSSKPSSKPPSSKSQVGAGRTGFRKMPVTVRMYNVGFGDCFLVTLEATDRNYRILFDCGRLAGSVPNTADELRFEAVIARLVDDLREKDEHGVERRRIDLLIVTHRHRDHVHGFSKTELWNDVEVGEVWMPWVEDPSNRHARALVEKQEQLARRTFRALKALRAAAGNGSNHALDSAAEIAYNATSNATAMKLLHEGLKTDHKNRFLPRLGYFPESLTTAELSGRIPEGVTMHVLGPSRDPDVMTSLDPPDGSAYEPFERKTATEHHDEADDDADAAEVPEPFGVTWVVKAREYSVGAVERRRVEQLAIAGAVSPLEMVYRLDRSINGTSLVVVIEVGDVKLLFPGDAQWGTWNAILQNAETRRLVEYATLYKVGHHGSHNATPKDYVENLIGDKPRPTSLVSVARTRYGGGWQNIPLPSLLAELTKRGPVIQSNTDTPRGQAYTEVRFEARIPIDKDHP